MSDNAPSSSQEYYNELPESIWEEAAKVAENAEATYDQPHVKVRVPKRAPQQYRTLCAEDKPISEPAQTVPVNAPAGASEPKHPARSNTSAIPPTSQVATPRQQLKVHDIVQNPTYSPHIIRILNGALCMPPSAVPGEQHWAEACTIPTSWATEDFRQLLQTDYLRAQNIQEELKEVIAQYQLPVDVGTLGHDGFILLDIDTLICCAEPILPTHRNNTPCTLWGSVLSKVAIVGCVAKLTYSGGYQFTWIKDLKSKRTAMVKHFVNVSPDLAHVLYRDIVVGQLVRVIGTLEYSHSTSKDIYVCTSALPEEVDDDLLKTHDLLAATFHMMVTSNAQTVGLYEFDKPPVSLMLATDSQMVPCTQFEHAERYHPTLDASI
ncbi:hypothetical protein L226DRAFT_573755 [Lentinus tigrinus ALCF2SS1-7]|uniref:uncharacterized protein n=1 Tax=Lentinus tigrinus ALCF2SS1-7 TaxID=1328758 RepID=UPI001166110E|nr:hypothetical protein L226DRAFT_573755 [Lentinus tigrinus ALCF2SS1-7]